VGADEPREGASARRELMALPSIARVCVDSPLPHLDRLFDYAIPGRFADVVTLGTRVRVPFSGRLVDAIVCEIATESDFGGRVLDLRSAASAPSATSSSIDLARAVARRYGGGLWDVLRLAIPPRAAAVEKRWATRTTEAPASRPERLTAALVAVEGWDASAIVPPGQRIVWEAPLGKERRSIPVEAYVKAAVTTAAHGESAILVVPDARALAALVAGLSSVGLRRWTAAKGGEFSIVQTEDGASTRYENFLAGLHGASPIVLGTRSTVFQPVPNLGLLAMWDDGHSAFHDPHAPYPHARTVASMRTESEGAALVLGGWVPTIDAVALVDHRWARWVQAPRERARSEAPLVEVMTSDRRDEEGPAGWHWMPGSTWRHLRSFLDAGPSFVLVPRAGYVTGLACARCGERAECVTCEGPLARSGEGAPPVCVLCGIPHQQWHCPVCHSDRLKEARQGVERVAEQLQRMAPEVRVLVSSAATGTLADGFVAEGLVVATPGALPAAPTGYSAGVIVGADTGLGRAGTEVDAARLWFSAAALVRARGDGGRVWVVGDIEPSVRRALETWTPGDLARGAAAERAALGLPPFRRVVSLEGAEDVLAKASLVSIGGTGLESHPEATALPSSAGSRTYLVSRRAAPDVVDALRAFQKEISASGGGELRMRVDGPLVLPR